MTDYAETDFACEDDLDPFMREVGPLEALEQDMRWMLRESRGSHPMDPNWGLGLEDYLGKPLPSNLESTIEQGLETDDRVQSARCVITRLDNSGEAYQLDIEIRAVEGFLRFAYALERSQPLAGAAVIGGVAPVLPAPTILSASGVSTAGGVSNVVLVDALPGLVITGSPGITLGTTSYIDATHADVIVPAHAAGVFDLLATQSSGNSGASGNGKLTVAAVAPAPALTSVRRTALATSSAVLLGGGESVTITGTNFVAGATLELSGPGSYSIATTGSGTALTIASMPALAKGSYTARVKNPDTQQSGTQSLTAVVNTASRNLSLWTEQGRGLDYAPAGTPPYTSLASAGASGGRTLIDVGGSFSPPTVGAAVDGTNEVRFGTLFKDLKSTLGLGSFVTATAFTLAGVVKLDAAPGAWAGSSAGPTLFTGVFTLVQAGLVGGGLCKMTFGMIGTSAAFTYVDSQTFPVGTTVAWVARYDGTHLKLRVNAVSATPVASTNMHPSYPAQTVRMGSASQGSTVHDRLSLITSPVAWTDAECDDQITNWREYAYPSAGL